MTDRSEYLFAQRHRREREAIDRLILTPGSAGISGFLLEASLGWRGQFSWYAVRIPTTCLLPAGVDPARFPGDVDLMGGPLFFDMNALARAMSVLEAQLPGVHPSHWHRLGLLGYGAEDVWQWPPPLNVITAAEVKSVFIDAEGALRGLRGGAVDGARRQADGLSLMGFDRAALLWLVLTEPVNGPDDVNPWLSASYRAEDGLGRLARTLATHEINEGIGEILIAAAAVPGGLEDARGAMSGAALRAPPDVQSIPGSEGAVIRASIEAALSEAFRRFECCPSLPVVVRACSRQRCQALFVAIPSKDPKCPACGASGR
jgi:hypothetical protein